MPEGWGRPFRCFMLGWLCLGCPAQEAWATPSARHIAAMPSDLEPAAVMRIPLAAGAGPAGPESCSPADILESGNGRLDVQHLLLSDAGAGARAMLAHAVVEFPQVHADGLGALHLHWHPILQRGAEARRQASEPLWRRARAWGSIARPLKANGKAAAGWLEAGC